MSHEFPTEQDCTELNRAALLYAMETPDERPCIEINGVQVYAYLDSETGAFRISVDLDTAPEDLPLKIDVGHAVVFNETVNHTA